MSKQRQIDKAWKVKLIRYGLVFLNSATAILVVELLNYYFGPTRGRTDLERASDLIYSLPIVSISLLVGLALIWLARRNVTE